MFYSVIPKKCLVNHVNKKGIGSWRSLPLISPNRANVWSRSEVVRIDFEDCGSFRPGLADDLIGRSPFQGLQVLGEVVGGDEG